MAKLTRRESRETAFALLFEWSFKDETLDEIVENAGIAREAVIDKFAKELAQKTIDNRDEIDLRIEQYSQGWKISRLSKTVLSVLRMSLCELTYFNDIPVGASINEAVELVKKFGTDDEATYLNGILGNFERVRKGERPEPPMPVKKPIEDTEPAPTIEEYEAEVQAKRHAESKQQAAESAPIAAAYVEKGEVETLDDIIIEVD